LNKVLNLLGIARRAGKLIMGTDSLIKVLPSKKIKLIFIAKDASLATIDKIDKKAYFYQVQVVNIFTTDELSKALGVGSIKIIGIADEGFAKSMREEIERGDLYEG
jgi:ribosomal protein L7Ae-like RNA K-turn-binding protein